MTWTCLNVTKMRKSNRSLRLSVSLLGLGEFIIDQSGDFMKQNLNYSGDSILIKRKRIYFGNAVLKYAKYNAK